MQEPSPRGSRLAIAGGLAAALVVGAGGFLLGRETAPPPLLVDRVLPIAEPTAVPTEPPLPAVLGRREILDLARAAADATASGRPLAPEVSGSAANRRFSLYLPFGCEGPERDATGGDSLRWRYDPKEGVLRLHVAPQVWEVEQWWPGAGAPEAEMPEVEAIEGFWLSRPWSSNETCAARAPAPAQTEKPVGSATEAAASGETKAARAKSDEAEPVAVRPKETVAIARFFPAGTSRQARRGDDPFESVIRIPPDQFQGQAGFRLRLTGRIEQVPGGGPVRCIQPEGADQRPVCVVAASIEEVAIENPANGKVLATWTLGQR